MRSLSRLWALSTLVLVTGVSCTDHFDTTREPRAFAQQASLGQDIYGVICDRVGAGALREDLTGASFRAVCHPDALGNYADSVEQTALPPVEGAAALTRNLAVAKVEAMARRRAELIQALDVILPDIEIDDPYASSSDGSPSKVRLHDAVRVLIQRLNPLYDSNPLASEGGSNAPLLPAATQSLGRLFQALSDSSEAQKALSGISGREGYRPLSVALGALSPVLRYPNLRSLSQQSVRILGPGGPARSQFVQLLNVSHEELRTSQPEAMPEPYLVEDSEGKLQPNRPRDNLELLQSVLLSTDTSFAGDALEPSYIVLRDPRGFALVTGSSLGVEGSVPAPFSDLDGNGLADVDPFGRFIDASGEVVSVDFPFDVPGKPRVRPADSQGRALLDAHKLAYQYIDTNQTLTAALLRDLGALVDPDPANDRETLLDAFSGAYLLFGDRVRGSKWVYGDGKKAEKKELFYDSFDPDTSPLVDLVYAAGQVLADPQSDDFLAQMIDLFENHEQEVARIVGVALELKRIADEHPEAYLPAESTFWDQVVEQFSQVAHEGASNGDPDGTSLTEDLLGSLADDRSIQLGPAFSKFFIYRDVINYSPEDVNGPPFNVSSQDYQPPHLRVDRSKPNRDPNRSAFQRSVQLTYDSSGSKACNRAGALVHLKAGVLGLNVDATYPTDTLFSVLCPSSRKDPLEFCDIYEIPDMATFYLQSLIEDDPSLPPEKNKQKAHLIVRDQCLNSLGGLTDMDQTFQDSSTVQGLTTHPTHSAMSRLVFFGADTPNYHMPDLDPYRDSTNERLNLFFSGLQDPIGAAVCPKNSAGVNICPSPADTFRVRDTGGLLLWEHFSFAESMRPLLFSFYTHDREDLFTDIVAVIQRHLSDETHGSECEKRGSWKKTDSNYNPKYCSEDGIVRYEELMSEQFVTDLFPAANKLVKVLQQERVRSHRYRAANGYSNLDRRGLELVASLAKVLFDVQYSKSINLTDRRGNRSTLWNDGQTVKRQLTPYDLFANALNDMDKRFASAKDYSEEQREQRKTRWKRARSQLVDRFLAVDGTGEHARFRNRAIPRAVVNVLKILREQLNAHCPERERGGDCQWARNDLAQEFADTLKGPLFSALVDLTDQIQQDPSRLELQRLIQYLLTVVHDDEELRSVLASAVDVIQVLRDGKTLPPVYQVLAAASVPDSAENPEASGAADIALQLLQVLSRDPAADQSPDDPMVFDRYRVLDKVLPNLVQPIDPAHPSKTALDVILDVISDVNRYDSQQQGPLSEQDYQVIAQSIHEFLTSPTRGMEQLYTVVRARGGN